VARIRAAEGRPECLATAPRTTCALADGATSAGAIYMLRASALRPQADGVTGAGFALTVKVLPDPPTGRSTENVKMRGLTPIMLRASALRPQADGVTGAGFALTVKVFARFTDRPINGKC